MEYRKLGNTGIEVSVIALGCEGFVENNDMAKLFFDRAEEAGINYFDMFTSDPAARDAVGKALEGRREKFIIQSHLCSTWKDGQYVRTRDLEETKAAFEDSLARMGTDFIDVGMIHYCDADSDWEDIVGSGILDYARQLKAEGKIRHIGLSSHNPKVAMRAIEEGGIEVLMFSVNYVYDMLPATENVDDLWADEVYEGGFENMDPDRQRLYELCESKGTGISVMKAFAGGDILDEKMSPAGAALTPVQCISYALSRPAVATVCSGARNMEQLDASIAYVDAGAEERDYAEAFAAFPKVSWTGHCIYCTHCHPCPAEINIADVTKFMNLVIAHNESNGIHEGTEEFRVPDTEREHYRVLAHHAGECLACGLCETRCPFGVAIRENMKHAKSIFGY
ncbi:MAG: aldo/keto reductase [Mogibacterium sp.]|nr:aldo/keto reductase [Mogibacterium sp.]